METVWFALLTFLLAGYVVLDGFDLGAGAISPWVARTRGDRAALLRSIGPLWDGNEVWLIAAGGTLFMAFPRLFSAAFAGFYLPLTIFVWLIVLRGLSIELRGHFESPVWIDIWDFVFFASSALLALVLGVALGNVVRGVPLDGEGWFFTPLWTDFTHYGHVGVLDPYTLLVGTTALSALAMHGASWLAHATGGDLAARARRGATRLWWSTALLTTGMTAASFALQPQLGANLSDQPWGAVFPLVAIGGLLAHRVYLGRDAPTHAFLGSGTYLAGMLASVAFGLYPLVLPSTLEPAHALTAANAHGPGDGTTVALFWWIPGMALVLGYTALVYRTFGRAKVSDPS
ncbi:MAG: cytochrome d ubiquinol oxidase subunit II [Deltaproteobacteria bacterium]